MKEKLLRKAAAACVSAALSVSGIGTPLTALAAETEDHWQEGPYEHDGTWYYGTARSDGEKMLFEKVSHPDSAPDELDGLNDDADRQSQSYAWSAQEYGDYIYVGTCYNSTYGIYWRAVYSMMTGLGKTPQEAMQIARDFVQFTFNDQFPESLSLRGLIVKVNKKTGEITNVFDSTTYAQDPAVQNTHCSGYRMAFEKDGKLYFVAMGNPTMFLVEVDPETDESQVVFTRPLTAEGVSKNISAGVHGLIVYDDEMIMCLASEQSDQFADGEMHPEGGLVVASQDGSEWRVIADENDLGPSAYHTYDGLMGGGIWDIIESNGHLYVTVVRDLTDPATGIVNKKGFAMYRGTKLEDGSFTWEEVIGDTSQEEVEYPYGLGCKYSMACNLWVYDGYLYLGTYNDPMLDLTAVAERGDFKDLYYDLYHSIMLYRMDGSEQIELVAGQTSDIFPERIGNLGDGLGDNGNQYVWRMETHNDELWLGTYDTSTLTSAFTQLTDGQLYGMSKEEYQKRLKQLSQFMKSLGFLKDKYSKVFEKALGSNAMRELFNALEGYVSAELENSNLVPAYEKAMTALKKIDDKINAVDSGFNAPLLYRAIAGPLAKTALKNIRQSMDKLGKGVYYFGTNYYMNKATKGFDLMVTSDGVNFDVLTRDGFGSEANHGLRVIESVDNGAGIYLGTANPFDGAQIWKLVTPNEVLNEEYGETQDEIPANVKEEAPEEEPEEVTEKPAADEQSEAQENPEDISDEELTESGV